MSKIKIQSKNFNKRRKITVQLKYYLKFKRKCRIATKFSTARSIRTSNSNTGEKSLMNLHNFFLFIKSSRRIPLSKTFIHLRHVILPHAHSKLVPKTHLMTETEWRNLGIQQSPGKYFVQCSEYFFNFHRRVDALHDGIGSSCHLFSTTNRI